MKLIECVPNFSEGRNKDTINQITSEISSVSNVKLLDVDPGKDTNRTVVTFAGHPDDVIEAAFLAISKASELIDMSKHEGAHPRMGATDVCPLIPIKGVSVDECIKYSHQLAKKVAQKLKIPIFMYEKSASSKSRENLAKIRQGEYEGMSDKLKMKDWKPDYGPDQLHIKSGVTAIGVREFLIAYNINLNTSDKKLASDIALDIREAGRAKRDKNGKIIRDKDGLMVKVPGTLKSVKAVGWFLDQYNVAQVSMNLIDYKTTSVHKVFEEVRKQAHKRGLRVTGSELVGLIPLDSLLEAGKYYLQKQNKTSGVSDSQLIHIAVKSMGLDEMYPFNNSEKIIDYMIDDSEKLINKTIFDFVDEVSSDSAAPGGGSISALAGSLSASLTSMVTNLSHDKKQFKDKEFINNLACKSQELKNKFLVLIDKDTDAFDKLMISFRLPKKSESEIKFRNSQILIMSKLVTEVPLEVLEKSLIALDLALEVLKINNTNCISDAGVAGEMAYSCGYGAYYNVKINLIDLKDDKVYCNKTLDYAKSIISKLDDKILKLRKKIIEGLSNG
tara:strand:- start:3649 stop:5322 length:1674 start_codon:yes stop_codon:yes gene_type:complete